MVCSEGPQSTPGSTDFTALLYLYHFLFWSGVSQQTCTHYHLPSSIGIYSLHWNELWGLGGVRLSVFYTWATNVYTQLHWLQCVPFSLKQYVTKTLILNFNSHHGSGCQMKGSAGQGILTVVVILFLVIGEEKHKQKNCVSFCKTECMQIIFICF